MSLNRVALRVNLTDSKRYAMWMYKAKFDQKHSDGLGVASLRQTDE
jgi:hypothetical protein